VPPFAIVESDQSTGDESYGGFQIDLLERLQMFAAEDNVTLNVDLSPAPSQYEDAFDLVANDCADLVEDTKSCDAFDMLAGDFYGTKERSMRAILTPAWLRSAVATVQYLDKTPNSPSITTLAEAAQAQLPVCILDGAFYSKAVISRHPLVEFVTCPVSFVKRL